MKKAKRGCTQSVVGPEGDRDDKVNGKDEPGHERASPRGKLHAGQKVTTMTPSLARQAQPDPETMLLTFVRDEPSRKRAVSTACDACWHRKSRQTGAPTLEWFERRSAPMCADRRAHTCERS